MYAYPYIYIYIYGSALVHFVCGLIFYASTLVQRWFSLLWPVFLRVSFGSVLVQLWCCYLVQLWFSFGSASCALIFPWFSLGSALVQLWFSFLWHDFLRVSFGSGRPHFVFVA